MSLAHFSAGACLIVFWTGAALSAPTTPSVGTQTKVESDSQMHNGIPFIKATAENNGTESATTLLGVELTSEITEGADCQKAWHKFMVSWPITSSQNCDTSRNCFQVDFGVHYESDTETQKRHGIFCANWQGIQEHNAQYEVGKVSFKKKINQWADQTIEEWKNKQRPILAPEFAVDQTRIKCDAAWKKFLTDFSRKYENEAETEKRRSIFCDKWQRIQEHNVQYEAGKVSYKKDINQWSDLTFEEWRQMQKPHFPPNMETPGIKSEATDVKEHPERTRFPANMEAPGTYVEETTMKPTAFEEPIQIKEIEEKSNKDLSGNKTEEGGSQKVWFPPNMEEPGTYIIKPKDSEFDQKNTKCQAVWEKFLSDYRPKYENDVETKIRRSIFCENWQRIQEHNTLHESGKVSQKESITKWSDLTLDELKNQSPNILPPNLKPSENEREETVVQVGPQQAWFPPNTE
ncbi:hypothetical protein KR038_010626, partial [Drosophila bunnanda]